MSSEPLDRITDAMAAHVTKGTLPGVLTLVARQGRIVHLQAVGWMDVERRVRMRPDAIFRIYSMTKPITAAAMMILFQEGRFRLTDPVSTYLPEFRDLTVFVGGTVGSPETAPARPMTIQHLLTHTSGLAYDDPSAAGVPAIYASADLFNVPSLEAFVRRLASLPLVAQPGTAWHYGVSSDVLGRIVEVLSGQPFDRFLAERIFEPLGMVDTGFYVPDERAARLAACYSTVPGGMKLSEAMQESPFRNSRSVPFGGHGLVSTAADYLRFAQMLADSGKSPRARILDRKTVDLMLANHLGPEFGPRPLAALQGSVQCDTTGIGFGFGGAVTTAAAEGTFQASAGTYSWGGNASTYVWIDRSARLIGILMTQLIPSDAVPIRAEMRAWTRAACQR